MEHIIYIRLICRWARLHVGLFAVCKDFSELEQTNTWYRSYCITIACSIRGEIGNKVTPLNTGVLH